MPTPHKNKKECLIKALLRNFVINLTLRFRDFVSTFLKVKFELVIFFIQISFQHITCFYIHVQYLFRQRIFQVFLDGPVQRTGTKLHIISFISQE